MTTESAARLESAVQATLPRDRRPTEDELRELAVRMRAVFEVTDDEFDRSLKALHARVILDMELGTALLAADHVPWLAGRKASIDPFYWERYRLMLLRDGRGPLVVTALDAVTDEILDLTGDPMRSGSWTRRGLVMGDVQSGKTGTYTGLIDKAADAGYRLVILLTGSLENLRRQTQERLDSGFVGLDSAERLKTQVATSRLVGVGLIDQSRTAMVFTSRSRDFNRALMNQLNLRLRSFGEPVLMVVKKNKRVLENLEDWLRSYNAGLDDRIDAPMLLFDDEADAGSINTNSQNDDPTKVNAAIRRLLALFHRSSYVGFTATPFANVFVDPDTREGMLGDDLFPRDFIYSLEAPTNYFGPEVVLTEDGGVVQLIEDAEPFFPAGHRNALSVTGLPESLYEAIRSYLLVATIRDMRSHVPPHRSMLVNVSPWTAVQNDVAALVDHYVREVQRDIRNFAALDEADALANASIAALKRTWARHHDDGSIPWQAIQRRLHDSVQPVVVRPVNQTTGAASLDYREQGEMGLRVIAVGGNSLSRGLTLEGLSTSYFYRNSQAYDTLMQMGRWFGYRDGYDDLCRVWMAEEAQGNFAYIANAAVELRGELRRMKRLGLTPREFGLKVRAHPGALVVTARNKMRRANDIVWEVSLDKELLETSRLRSSPAAVRSNNEAVANWMAGLARDLGDPIVSTWKNLTWPGVPKERIVDLLGRFLTHQLNHDFHTEELGEYLRQSQDPVLQTWDVAVFSGSADEIPVGPIRVRPRTRRVLVKSETASILVSGSSARVGSPTDEREGLTRDEVAAAEAEYEGRTTPGSAYRERRSRPLLMVNILRPVQQKQGGGRKDVEPLPDELSPLVALGISFPHFDDSDVQGCVAYKVNEVYWRSLFEQEAGDDPGYDDELD